jgi:extracellular matrix regulatory protein A
MNDKLINIGFSNIVSVSRIVAIICPESAPVKRMITEARSDKRLIDVTYGRKTRSVVIMDSNHILLSAIQPETVSGRFSDKEEK